MRGESSISRDFMDSVAEQVARLRAMGVEVLIVSSGAIPIGLKAMGVRPKPNEIPIRQAASAVGQGILMREWGDCFQRHGLTVGQVLMTLDNYSDRTEAVNMNNTIESLLRNGVVPIFNENDAVCISEIKFGDNDTLSAIVASRTDADLLVILSDVAGLYTSDPTSNPDAKLIPVVWNVEDVSHMAGGPTSGVGTGGMRTKLNAARICHDATCTMIIALSKEDQVIYRAVIGDDVGTLFVATAGISKKRRWIKSAHPAGRVVIDEGAMRAVADHRSLLPVGIRDVEGRFNKGDVVEIACGGTVVAKGIIGYDSTDLKMIKGRHSDEIEGVLGYKAHDDAILSENIALLLRQLSAAMAVLRCPSPSLSPRSPVSSRNARTPLRPSAILSRQLPWRSVMWSNLLDSRSMK